MKSNKVLLITIFILSILLALTLGIIIGIYLPIEQRIVYAGV